MISVASIHIQSLSQPLKYGNGVLGWVEMVHQPQNGNNWKKKLMIGYKKTLLSYKIKMMFELTYSGGFLRLIYLLITFRLQKLMLNFFDGIKRKEKICVFFIRDSQLCWLQIEPIFRSSTRL